MGRSILFTGPMKSGKSLELLKVAHTLDSKNIPYLSFKPKADTRDRGFIKSRCADFPSIPCVPLANPNSVIPLLEQHPVQHIIFDEINLFTPDIIGALGFLYMEDVNVYAAGLDTDFRGNDFMLNGSSHISMLSLKAEFDEVVTLYAECEVCSAPATHTQRLRFGKPVIYTSPLIVIEGDGEYTYQARCAGCHKVPGRAVA